MDLRGLVGTTFVRSRATPGGFLCAAMALILSGCVDIEGIPAEETEPTEPTVRPVSDVKVFPGELAMTIEQRLQLGSFIVDVEGRVLDREPAWSTGDSTVAVVDSTGLVTGVGVGSTEATASSEGKNDSATIDVSVPEGFVRIAPGGLHTCGLSTNGGAYCWGRPLGGRLGVGTVVATPEDPQPRPAPVQGDHEFTVVTAGTRDSCGLSPIGRSFCWGMNFFGSLGNGDPSQGEQNVPVRTTAGSLVVLVTGGSHTCGVSAADGMAYCWGSNYSGEVGNGGDPVEVLDAVAVVGGLTFTSLAAGTSHTCGVDDLGAAHCWGANRFGQIGIGETDGLGDQHATPQPVTGGLAFASLTLGDDHSCGLLGDGTAYCWGLDGDGQLGSGGTTPGRCTDGEGNETPCTASPQEVAGGLAFAALAAGGSHTCGITVSGDTYCWGLNDHGQLGVGLESDPVLEPRRIDSDLVFESLAGGAWHTCGIMAGDVAYCWGRNDYGQLGDGTLDDRSAPVRVLGQS